VTWREGRAHQTTQPGVHRRVDIDHRSPHIERIGIDVVDLDVANL